MFSEDMDFTEDLTLDTQMDNIISLIENEANEIPSGSGIPAKRRGRIRNRVKKMMSGGGAKFDASLIPPLMTPSGETQPVVEEVIYFSSKQYEPIKLFPRPKWISPPNASQFNVRILEDEGFWHQVSIRRNKASKHLTRRDFFQEIVESVNPDLLIPVRTRLDQELIVDKFLVHKQNAALQRFMDQKLMLKAFGVTFPIRIELGAGDFVSGEHPEVGEMVRSSLDAAMKSARQTGKVDLSNLPGNSKFFDYYLNLRNKGAANLFFSLVNEFEEFKSEFTFFTFENNRLETLEYFTKLFDFTMKVLDLRRNNITSIAEFHYLKHLGEINELYLTDNEITKIHDYREKIFAILPNVVIIDGMRNLKSLSAAPLSSLLETLKKKPALPPVASSTIGSGTGNDPIADISDGIMIKRDPKRRDNFSMLRNTFASYRDDAQWTQVIIYHSGAATEKEMLDSLTIMMCQVTFFPCYYQRFENRDEFFLYKNFDALMVLMSNDLEVTILPSNEKANVVLKMNLAKFEDGQVCWISKIQHVLRKRVLPLSTTADLDGFFSDLEFKKMKLLQSKRNLGYITDQCFRVNSNVTRINFKNNNLTSLEGFALLKFTKVTTFDLRNNKLRQLTGIARTSWVKEVMLDNNPICEDFNEPMEYISHVKYHFPHLEYLDGHLIDSTSNLTTLQNYLVVRDAYILADEFCQNFFNLYDSARPQLNQLYTNSSIFSLSTDYVGNRLGASEMMYRRIRFYAKYSRDLSKISNMEQILLNIIVGENSIKNLFSELPKTSHNFLTFCIDVPYYEPKNRVVITVTGTFDDHGTVLNEPTLLISFSRTFVLVPGPDNTFTIANEKLFIRNPTQIQSQPNVARKMPNKENFIESQCKDLLPTEVESKEAKYLLFKELTELKKEECVKLLEQSFWDIKVALATFVTLMDSDSIPDRKFEFK